jgi:hypothetical protein
VHATRRVAVAPDRATRAARVAVHAAAHGHLPPLLEWGHGEAAARTYIVPPSSSRACPLRRLSRAPPHALAAATAEPRLRPPPPPPGRSKAFTSTHSSYHCRQLRRIATPLAEAQAAVVAATLRRWAGSPGLSPHRPTPPNRFRVSIPCALDLTPARSGRLLAGGELPAPPGTPVMRLQNLQGLDG